MRLDSSVASLPRNDTGRDRFVTAFTLTEMLVALAVMVLVMAMVTTAFSITTKTAATSAAIADVEALARNFADQLQQDLECCDPSRSILVIHGRTQGAGLTEEQRQGGQFYRVMVGDPQYVPADYDTRFDPSERDVNGTAPRDQFSNPRADILMFFTERPTASKAPAVAPGSGFQWSLYRGARQSPIQVVYGHAAHDKAVQSGGVWQFADDLQHIETAPPTDLSPLPANRWHLARRATILDPNSTIDPRWGFTYAGGQAFDRIARCYSTDTDFAADAVYLNLADYLSLFAPGVNQWATYAPNLPLRSPYQVWCTVGYAPLPQPHPSLQWAQAESYWVYNVLYPNGDETDHHVATVIEQPPATLADNLGVHLLSGCVWFQVELLLPEDPRNGLEHPLSDQRRDTPRWVEVDAGQTYVFVPDTVENRRLVESQINPPDTPASVSRLSTFAQVVPPTGTTPTNYGGLNTLRNREVRLWPYGIRVTVRVLDQRGRLEEPIVRSVVHRFE